jgi:hypothetical protein
MQAGEAGKNNFFGKNIFFAGWRIIFGHAKKTGARLSDIGRLLPAAICCPVPPG